MKTRGHNPGGPLGWIRSWFLVRGEQVVFATGAWLGLLVLGVVLAGSVWTFQVHREAKLAGLKDELAQTAQIVATASEPLIDADDVGAVQALLNEVAARGQLSDASVRLAGGAVIADLRGSAAADTSIAIPDTWATAASVTTGVTQRDDGSYTALSVGKVVGRGDVIVELTRAFAYSPLTQRRVQAGIGVIAAGALAGGLLLYRVLRSRMRALGAIQESLKYAGEFEEGELPTTGLRLSDDLGEEARAWNRLLSERDYLKQRDKLEQAAERLDSTLAGGGDYAAAFDAVWLGLIVLDEQCTIRAINGAAAVLLRTQKPDAQGKHVEATVPFRDVTQLAQLVASGKQRQRASLEVTQEPTDNGSEKTVIRVTIRPMRREDGCAAMLVLEDVTQQRVANESRNAFVASATHELRSPLTSMRLYLEQLVEEGDKDPLVKARCLNVLTSETRRLQRIVGDMLSASEMDAGTFTLRTDDVDIAGMFEELERDYRAMAGDKEIALAFQLPPKWPSIKGDRDKICMALHNLIGNALKYTPTGGQVTVKAIDAGGALVVDVSDNGIGIKPDEQELVFEKFYRSKDKRIASVTGSGIGLSLAREVIRLHGGDITLQSQIDKGSTFTLTVPAAQVPMLKAAA